MTTRTPHDDPRPPSEGDLRELLARGLPELGAADEQQLARTWRRIAEQLDEGDSEHAGDPEHAGHDAPAPGTESRPRTDARDDADRRGGGSPPVVTELAGRAGPRTAAAGRVVGFVPMAAAAAVALVVGIGVGLAWPRGVAPETPAAVATYQLEPLGAATAAPVNAVLLDDEGVRRLEVDLSTLPTTTGYHEVWLLDPATGALASLGPVRPDNSYVVPPGTDLATLTALDVSDEPLDGDPGHSGDSLLRGEVRWTG